MLLEYFLLDLFQLFLMHVLHLRRKGFLFYDDVMRALVVLLCSMIPLGCARFPEILQNFSERQILWRMCSVVFHALTLKLPIQTSLSQFLHVQVKNVKISAKRAHPCFVNHMVCEF